MVFWLTSIGLAAICAGFLVYALLRPRGGATPAAAYDLQVYRDQLAEVERDAARGLLAPEDAERARIEVKRRILEADRVLSAAGPRGGAPAVGSRALAGLTALAVIGGAAVLYSALGQPGARDLPLQTRLAAIEAAREGRPTQAEAEAGIPEAPAAPEGADPGYLELVERLRETVASRPADIQGNALLARHEAALGRYRAAYAAQERLIAARGGDADAADYAQLAELMIAAARGYISPEAEAALRATLARDPANGTARYYSGVMFAQAGRYDRAFELWRGLLAEGREGAPWMEPVRRQIGQIAQLAGRRLDPALLRPRTGPTAGDVAAAGEMSAEDRTGMIGGMVARLAKRLEREGGSPAEWAQLINAYGVLGRTGEARAALARAEAAHAGDRDALAHLRDAAIEAGIGE